ncbi:hypothetical protein V5P93_000980 [Actinokineospora auranticolor]|uniref:hypothetical protein n=1 Tax=Actinokineospora auranticolor TaxID=155976 RepID=UPI0011B0BCC5|nr:hypothetical protein [Actinokineospora auranticolor]
MLHFDSLAVLVVGAVVIAVLVLIGFTVHRLANSDTKRIPGTIIAIVAVLSAVPPIVFAFQGFSP